MRLLKLISIAVVSASQILLAQDAVGKSNVGDFKPRSSPRPEITFVEPSTIPALTESKKLHVVAKITNLKFTDNVIMEVFGKGRLDATKKQQGNNVLTVTWEVELLKGPNKLTVLAQNTYGEASAEIMAEFQEPGPFRCYKGKQLAVIFGGGQYDNWEPLANPVNDARTLQSELFANYGVMADLVENATQDQILMKLREYAQKLFGERDELFIFFAGHGWYDEVMKEGFLIAKDSKLDDVGGSSYLSYERLRNLINGIPCKHILLVIDACFGGTIDRSLASRGKNLLYNELTNEEFIDRKLSRRTRAFITSGGKQYVPDGRPGMHSPFTAKLLEALRTKGGEDGMLTIAEIRAIVEKTIPEPQFGAFGDNEAGSEFLFIAK